MLLDSSKQVETVLNHFENFKIVSNEDITDLGLDSIESLKDQYNKVEPDQFATEISEKFEWSGISADMDTFLPSIRHNVAKNGRGGWGVNDLSLDVIKRIIINTNGPLKTVSMMANGLRFLHKEVNENEKGVITIDLDGGFPKFLCKYNDFVIDVDNAESIESIIIIGTFIPKNIRAYFTEKTDSTVMHLKYFDNVIIHKNCVGFQAV